MAALAAVTHVATGSAAEFRGGLLSVVALAAVAVIVPVALDQGGPVARVLALRPLVWLGVISYGVSSYGYDMRVAREFKIFTNALSAIVDPKAFDPKSFVDHVGDRVGMDRFNTVWSGPDTLPLPDEIEAPQQWIDRVL